ncbi:sensor histidine kinase [Mobilicoccus massiliensis]|uniref:sensor histidine kinase n=1 Tax=Mobilicoccus massiliensis TaxID=1522310 RepID=UPI001144947B|nr:sensor histidine kinase [Mobilicoccus massiliensis]
MRPEPASSHPLQELDPALLRDDREGAEWLRRLRILALVLPTAFLLVVLVGRGIFVRTISPDHGHAVLDAALVVGTIAFSVTMFSLIDRSYRVVLQESRDVAAVDATFAERDRIAREMHDSLAQALGAAHLRLAAIGHHPDVSASPEVRAELEDLGHMCHEAYGDVREAILGLRESGRTDRTLLESLETYVATFSRQSGIATSLDTALGELTMPPHHELQLIRVVQEALTNVRKHSHARTAHVCIGAEPGSVVVVVEDDGCGFDARDIADNRFGLSTMSERTHLLGGRLTIDSSPGGGTRVLLMIPAGRGIHVAPAPQPAHTEPSAQSSVSA